mgnify:CR=1 FL=1
MANKKGTGLMMIGADIPAELEEEFNRWYQEEHLQELLGVPGILSAARYEATKSGPKHLAVYELESVDVINTDAFKNRPRTPWGEKVSPSLIGTNNINLVLDMIHPSALTDEIARSEEHTSELQSRTNLVCRLLLEKKKKNQISTLVSPSHTNSSPLSDC